MLAYTLRRVLALIPTLFFATVIVFVTVRFIPGSVVDLMLAQNPLATENDRAALEAALGLDQPVHVQYLRWIGDALQGDLGRSLWHGTPIAEELGRRLPVTLELGLLALLVSIVIGLPIGVYSAVRQDTTGDYAARSFSILLLAVPNFWLATLVMIFPSIWWGWSPELRFIHFTGDPLGHLKQMLLPAAILGASLSAVIMRLARTTMLEVLRQDYIRTAWAKGLSERLVVMRHALRNALIPVVTLVGLYGASLIGGAIIVETVFAIPGMGRWLIEAVGQRDYPVVTGIFLVVGVCVMLVNLLVDLSYGLLDPKVRYR